MSPYHPMLLSGLANQSLPTEPKPRTPPLPIHQNYILCENKYH